MEVEGQTDEDDDLEEIEGPKTCDPTTGIGAHPRPAGVWFHAIYSKIYSKYPAGFRVDPRAQSVYPGDMIEFGPWEGTSLSDPSNGYNSTARFYVGTEVVASHHYGFRNSAGSHDQCNRSSIELYDLTNGQVLPPEGPYGTVAKFGYYCGFIELDGKVFREICEGPLERPYDDDRLILTGRTSDGRMLKTIYRRCTTPGCPEGATPDLNDQW